MYVHVYTFQMIIELHCTCAMVRRNASVNKTNIHCLKRNVLLYIVNLLVLELID